MRQAGLPLAAGMFLFVGAALGWIWDEAPRRAEPLPISGEQWVLVYIGGPTCSAAVNPRVMEELKGARSAIEGRLRSTGLPVVTVGVSQGGGIEADFAHLRDVGEFMEVSLGGGVLNTGMRFFMIQHHIGPAATPQLLVLRRRIPGGGPTLPRVWEEQVVMRLVGGGEFAAALRDPDALDSLLRLPADGG